MEADPPPLKLRLLLVPMKLRTMQWSGQNRSSNLNLAWRFHYDWVPAHNDICSHKFCKDDSQQLNEADTMPRTILYSDQN